MPRGRKGRDYHAEAIKCLACDGLGFKVKPVPLNAAVRSHGVESIKLNCKACRGTGARKETVCKSNP